MMLLLNVISTSYDLSSRISVRHWQSVDRGHLTLNQAEVGRKLGKDTECPYVLDGLIS